VSRDKAAARLDRLLRDLSTETVLLHQAIADRLGLNPTDHKCLGLLVDAGRPVTPGELATLTGLTTGAVTGVVDRLEAAGFVRRTRDPEDRRKVGIEVVFERVKRQVFPVFEQLARRMGVVAGAYKPREIETIVDFLEKGIEVSREFRTRLQGEQHGRRGD
jgi:DNA-binding MarR family transcriptional regulator